MAVNRSRESYSSWVGLPLPSVAAVSSLKYRLLKDEVLPTCTRSCKVIIVSLAVEDGTGPDTGQWSHSNPDTCIGKSVSAQA